MDPSEITARYERERRGGSALPSPDDGEGMMVKVLLYAHCVGAPSSRRIANRLHEDIASRVRAANHTPNLRTISDFRKEHLDALSGLFLQVLLLCRQARLVKLGHVVLDGTRMEANASMHKAMSYGRMQKEEQEKVNGEWSLIRTTHNLLMVFEFGHSVINPGLPVPRTP